MEPAPSLDVGDKCPLLLLILGLKLSFFIKLIVTAGSLTSFCLSVLIHHSAFNYPLLLISGSLPQCLLSSLLPLTTTES